MQNHFKLLSTLLRGAWLIEPNYAEANLPFIQNLLAGQSPAAEQDKPLEVGFMAVAQGTIQVNRYTSLDEAPAGSVAIIDLNGPIMKDDNCGAMGTISLAERLAAANRHPNIAAIILRADTPGGAVYGTGIGADAVANSEKPVVTWIQDGILASAGVWITAGSTEIYAGRPTDAIGSIGVYQRLIDQSGAYDKMGLVVHEIYADGSEDKNGPYRAALAGEFGPLKEELNFIRENFISTIQAHRPNVDAAAFTGKMFHAEEAQELGLIDGILSFEQVVNRAQELASSIAPTTLQDKKPMFSKFKKVAALKGEEVEASELVAANEELTANGITGAELVPAGTLQAHEAEQAHTNAELEAARELAIERGNEISVLQADLATAQNRIAELTNQPAGEMTNLIQEGSDHIGEAPKEMSSWERKASRLKR